MAGASKIVHALLFLVAVSEAHNITVILKAIPEYSLYNNYLTETGLADEINTRSTLTVLVLNNANMSSLASNHTVAGIKNALRLLTLLDYFDLPKLQSLSTSTLSATLLQTTGAVAGNSGFLNITHHAGLVAFGAAATGSKLESFYTRSVKQIPYNISVLQISAPIIFPGLIDSAAVGSTNLTQLLQRAGCKTFAGLLASSGVMSEYEAKIGRGALTVLAPRDEAFHAHGLPNINSLSKKDLATVLLYHALPSYTPKASLKVQTRDIRTLASTGAQNFVLSATSRGDDIIVVTGIDSSRVVETVLDSPPVCLMTVDSVLLPAELLGNAPAPAPSKSLSEF